MTASTTTSTTERQIPMTYEARLAWSSESRLSEWVDGEAIEFVPPTIRHQDVTMFFITLHRLFVGMRGLGTVLGSPIEVRRSSRRRTRTGSGRSGSPVPLTW